MCFRAWSMFAGCAMSTACAMCAMCAMCEYLRRVRVCGLCQVTVVVREQPRGHDPVVDQQPDRVDVSAGCMACDVSQGCDGVACCCVCVCVCVCVYDGVFVFVFVVRACTLVLCCCCAVAVLCRTMDLSVNVLSSSIPSSMGSLTLLTWVMLCGSLHCEP